VEFADEVVSIKLTGIEQGCDLTTEKTRIYDDMCKDHTDFGLKPPKDMD